MDLTQEQSDLHTYQNRLDQEFSQILSLLKPYIRYINNPYYLNQCCIWLKKLSYSRTNEKIKRNQYLIQLANQIQDGILREPFTRPPPPGLLEPLNKNRQLSSNQNIVQCETPNWNYFFSKGFNKKINPDDPYCEHYQEQEISDNIPLPNERSKRNLQAKKKKLPQKIRKRSQEHYGEESDVQFQNDIRRQDNINLERSWSQKHTQQTKTNLVTQSNHSSWYDLTDGSVTPSAVFASGDREKTTITLYNQENKNKIDKTQLKSKHELEGLKQLDHFSQQFKEKSKVDVTTASKITVNSVSGANEVEALKYRLQDLVEVKNALQDTYYSTEDWTFTIQSLKKELSEFQKQNSELQNIIKMNQLEIANFKKHMQEEKVYYEDIINKNNLKFEEIVKEKTEEIVQLNKRIADYENKINVEQKNTIKQQENDNQQEEQVHYLKKCISKMNKMYQKAEKEHSKLVEDMKEEVEKLQIKLQTQKAELLANITAVKHTEFDAAVTELEIKYKKILEIHQSESSLNQIFTRSSLI